MTVRFATSVVWCVCAGAAAFAQAPALNLPNLSLPPGATLQRTGSWPQLPTSVQTRTAGADPERLFSIGLTNRFLATGDLTSTVAHYSSQLAGAGWKKSFESPHQSLIVHRYAVDSSSGPQIGSLLVLSVPEDPYQFVGIRLVRPRVPFQWSAARSGGGGANGWSGLTLPRIASSGFRLPELSLPASVKRLDVRGGSSGSDAVCQESQLETLDTPSAIMNALEPQFANDGWKADLRGGDAVQRYTTFIQPGGANSVVCVILTALPGGTVDAAIWAVRFR